MRYDVIDINTDEVMASFPSIIKAHQCRDEMNEPHLDKFYVVRQRDPKKAGEMLANLSKALEG